MGRPWKLDIRMLNAGLGKTLGEPGAVVRGNQFVTASVKQERGRDVSTNELDWRSCGIIGCRVRRAAPYVVNERVPNVGY